MPEKKIIIAIDGFSSCGKSTVAKSLAKILGYIYIDSGAMYRAVTLFALRNGWITDDYINFQEIINSLGRINISFKWDSGLERNTTYLNNENVEDEIRKIEVSAFVSKISAISEVRAEMVKQQRSNGRERGVVMDGRDIGTVVFPDAELKIFMTASPEVRAKRRYDELISKGQEVNMDQILENVLLRDKIDSTREVSPLKKADDAWVLDNSNLSRQEQLNWILEKVNLLTVENEN